MNATTHPQAVWNGKTLRDGFIFAADYLQHHRDHVNALNVFPVPDGDTGTNMALTMQGALDAVADTAPDATVGQIAERLAHGALMGARGNSGVILSQILRGFATGLDAAIEMDGRDLARALANASATAYKAVMRPVEGTMLTVTRGAADAARESSAAHPAIADVLRAARHGAQMALDKTPEQLDILRQAGVVDAGGQGVVYLLDGLLRSALGDTNLPDVSRIAGAPGEEMAFLDMVDDLHGEEAFGYCTNFMVHGTNIDTDSARNAIAAMGQSAVIVGDDSALKVHIHALNPGEVLSYALRFGELDQIKIDNMSLQTETLSAQRKAVSARAARPPVDAADLVHDDIAIIAVAAGAGISEALISLGVTSIVSGGQTMNPSTKELLEAVETAPANQVILLPNNKNIIMAANQVANLTGKTVRVVPTRSIPAALSALTTFNTDQSLDDNVADMIAAMDDSCAVAITRAVRDVDLHGLPVTAGQVIGLVNDELATAGDDELDVVRRTMTAAEVDDPELFTVFVGENVSQDDATSLESLLAETWPNAEIEVHHGGQPHYRFIVSIE